MLQKYPMQSIKRIAVPIILSIVVLGATSLALAGSGHTASGWGWGGTEDVDGVLGAYDGVGWVSFNSSDCDTNNNTFVDALACGGADNNTTPVRDYGVYIPPAAGVVSGYAWSEHYGWISFDGTDLAGCVPLLAQAKREVDDTLSGGARILAIKEAMSAGNAGGFDGCINLAGVDTTKMIGTACVPSSLACTYAWSSDLGWIELSGVAISSVAVPTPSLIICPAVIPALATGGTVDLVAYYRPNGVPLSSCAMVNTMAGDVDVTEHASTTWSHPGGSMIATVSNSSGTKGIVTGGATAGVETITAVYNDGAVNLTATKQVTVGCTCNPLPSTRCVGVSYSDTCGTAGACVGTMSCALTPQ